MSTIPSSNNTTFFSAVTIFTWSGAIYKAVSDLTFKHGYDILEVPTTGTNIPYYGTGKYHGEIDITAIGSSDNQMWLAAFATSGIVPTMGMTAQPQNQVGLSGQTWYMSGKVKEFQHKWNNDKEVEYKLKLTMTGPPVIS